MSALSVVTLALHVAAWSAGITVAIKSLHLPPPQTVFALACSGLLLLAARMWPRRWRAAATVGVLVLFDALTVWWPLDQQFVTTGFMGDGPDYAEHRDKFEENIPLSAEKPEVQFKSHLADVVLATVAARRVRRRLRRDLARVPKSSAVARGVGRDRVRTRDVLVGRRRPNAGPDLAYPVSLEN